MTFSFDRLVFALGGASWTKTGSTGSWKALFEEKHIPMKHFEASNAGMNVVWKPSLENVFGSVLQNVNVKLGTSSKFGNLTFTKYGLKGTPIYWLNKAFRDEKCTQLLIDFLPQWQESEVAKVLSKGNKVSDVLKKELKLKKSVIELLRNYTTKSDFFSPTILAEKLKNFTLEIESLRPIEEAFHLQLSTKTLN